MVALAGSILPAIIQIALYFVERSKMSLEQKKAFYEWTKAAGKDLGSVKLTQAGDKQLQWFADNPNWQESP